MLHSTNIVIILGMMQVSKRIPFDDPNTLNIVRALYIASNLIIAAIYLYTQIQINKKKGTSTTRRQGCRAFAHVTEMNKKANKMPRSDDPQVCRAGTHGFY